MKIKSLNRIYHFSLATGAILSEAEGLSNSSDRRAYSRVSAEVEKVQYRGKRRLMRLDSMS